MCSHVITTTCFLYPVTSFVLHIHSPQFTYIRMCAPRSPQLFRNNISLSHILFCHYDPFTGAQHSLLHKAPRALHLVSCDSRLLLARSKCLCSNNFPAMPSQCGIFPSLHRVGWSRNRSTPQFVSTTYIVLYWASFSAPPPIRPHQRAARPLYPIPLRVVGCRPPSVIAGNLLCIRNAPNLFDARDALAKHNITHTHRSAPSSRALRQPTRSTCSARGPLYILVASSAFYAYAKWRIILHVADARNMHVLGVMLNAYISQISHICFMHQIRSFIHVVYISSDRHTPTHARCRGLYRTSGAYIYGHLGIIVLFTRRRHGRAAWRRGVAIARARAGDNREPV